MSSEPVVIIDDSATQLKILERLANSVGGWTAAIFEAVSAAGGAGVATAGVAEAVSRVAPGTTETLSFAVTTGRFEENKRGVRTMTSAISTSAKSVRLSMQLVELP